MRNSLQNARGKISAEILVIVVALTILSCYLIPGTLAIVRQTQGLEKKLGGSRQAELQQVLDESK